jgi:hypothetical protein
MAEIVSGVCHRLSLDLAEFAVINNERYLKWYNLMVQNKKIGEVLSIFFPRGLRCLRPESY